MINFGRRRTILVGALGLALAGLPGGAKGQYYGSGYNYQQPYYGPPPCSAVTPSPFAGAARGAAGGAVIGAIAGDAGRGAAIGAGIGGVSRIIRRSSARSAGACY